ncbi:MAG: septal ring lytic transglycosylase RlpA family protein [Candidatus Cloacimonadota bacterium]|nr:septal ring lytic transglycosylase RlpA family protein [Candidatus Cloacimonadota bacterium]
MHKFAVYILMMLLLTGCSSTAKYKTKTKKYKGYTRSYSTQVNKNMSNKVQNFQEGKVLYFVTSYYGEKFHGRPTSNGEIFDMNKYTCAHKELPFNTKLRVTNEDTKKSVVVRVNDRGPFIPGRDLDISYAAAKKIGLTAAGVKKLKVEILEYPNE